MKFFCPECSEENEIKGATCNHCNEPLDKHTLVRLAAVPLFSIITLLLGAGGATLTDNYLEKNRYPIAAEYSIIEECTSSYPGVLSVTDFKKKRKICVEALEETQDEFSYSEAIDDQKMFLKSFKENIEKRKRGTS